MRFWCVLYDGAIVGENQKSCHCAPGLKADDTLMRTILFYVLFFFILRKGCQSILLSEPEPVANCRPAHRLLHLPAILSLAVAKRRLRAVHCFLRLASSINHLSICQCAKQRKRIQIIFLPELHKNTGKKMHAKVGRKKNRRSVGTRQEC